MKSIALFLTLILITGCDRKTNDNFNTLTHKKGADSIVYKIILKTYNSEPMGEGDSIEFPGEIDTIAIQNLNEPLRALVAFYSALGGTACDDTSCELTTALGIGNQGSVLHRALIKKYFPNDKVADTVLLQQCSPGKEGSCCFSDYEYLTIINIMDTVKVDYSLSYEAWADFGDIKGTDSYLLKNNKFSKIKRHIWNNAGD